MSIVCFPAVQMVLHMALIIGSVPTTRSSTRCSLWRTPGSPASVLDGWPRARTRWLYVKQNKFASPVCPLNCVCVEHRIFVSIGAGRRFCMRRDPTEVSTDVGGNLRRSM